MAANQIYVGDVGTIISLDTKLSPAILATATVHNIIVQKQDKTEVVWVGSIVGTTVEYIIQVNDLDQAGTYKMQAYLEMPTWSGKGATALVKVFAKFK